MKVICKYLLGSYYANTLVLAGLSVATIFLHKIYPFEIYITIFLVATMLIVLLLSPILRFKGIVFGENRVLFLTPKPYLSILTGYLLSEFIIFLTYFLSISICLFSLHGKVSFIDSFSSISVLSNSFTSYSCYILIHIFEVWLLFTTAGILSVVLTRKNITKKNKFLSVKIFMYFVIIQFISIIVVALVGFITPKIFTRCIISAYIFYLAYRKITDVDIY